MVGKDLLVAMLFAALLGIVGWELVGWLAAHLRWQ